MSTRQVPETERYLQFLQCIEISELFVLDLKASRLPEIKRPSSGALSLSSNVNLDKLTSKNLRAVVVTRIKGTNEQSDSLFQCDLVLRVHYSFAPPKTGLTDDRELVDRFLKTNVMVNVWPYLREYVAWLTTNMGVGTALLPLLKPSQEPSKSDEA